MAAGPTSPRRLAIGSDHIGYFLKEEIKAYLETLGIEYQDFGPASIERTHYPLYAEQVARAILNGEVEGGILICGTGIGMAIAANKIAGIRAVVCSEPYSAALSRQHNNTNVLAFGSQVVGVGLAQSIVNAWLGASYEGGRHDTRLQMICQLEVSETLEGKYPDE